VSDAASLKDRVESSHLDVDPEDDVRWNRSPRPSLARTVGPVPVYVAEMLSAFGLGLDRPGRGAPGF
jgi:hypothetical protein